MSDRIRAVRAALVALALICTCAAPIAQAQSTGTIEINVTGGPAGGGGGGIAFAPFPPATSNGVGSTNGKDPFTQALEPGYYVVVIRSVGGLVRRWIRIEKGKKATVSVSVDDMPPGGVDVSPGKTDAALVERIDRAAKACDAATYNAGKHELEIMEKELTIELEGLEQMVKDEAERTHLPDDAAKLKEMLGTPAGTDEAKAPRDPVATANLVNFEALVRQRDQIKARLKTVEAELASLPALKCPPTPAETPPSKPAEEKPPVKPSEREGR
jgi:hypothetical protein